MKLLLLDPIGGLAGDMLVGALLDLGVSADLLRLHLSSLGLPRFELVLEETTRRGIGCTLAKWIVPEETKARYLPEIRSMFEGSSLPERARLGALDAFERLADAEAAIHRIPKERVHFHEVGAADAILDIAAVSLGLTELGIQEIRTGPLPGGSGTFQCAHGEMPALAPATLELLEGFPILAGVGQGEQVTPTGAALLRVWGAPLTPGSVMIPKLNGYGAGTRSESLLRLALVESPQDQTQEHVTVLETNIDDATGEQLGFLMERLFHSGALDVSYSSLVMKKGRPGVALQCIAPTLQAAHCREVLLRESSTLGVRETQMVRTILTRTMESVETRFGRIEVKVAGSRMKPEFEACAQAARSHEVSLDEVYDEVQRAYFRR